MPNEQNNHPADQENIDLLLLAERFLQFLKRFGKLFAAALLLGLTAGFLFFKLTPKTYKARLVLHSSLLSNPEQIQIVEGWNQLLKEQDYKTLSAQFNCPEELLTHLKQLKAKEIQQVFTPNNPNGFTVDVFVSDNQVLPALQQAIITGFENNEYAKERLAVKRSGFEQLITKTEAEIAKLDSTKGIIENLLRGNSRSASQLIVDGSSINRQIIEMNEKLLGFKENLKFTKAVQLLKSFSPSKKTAGPGMKTWMAIGALTFLCLAWIAATLFSVNQKLKERKSERRHR